ncbi:MAG TPA: ATP-binding protein [Smithellaceae bacterium]|nr:ATP-binding protein [Smithellaceae bacterium]HPV50353.1 ATP-binding protein [Smithellaceae bacterium]
MFFRKAKTINRRGARAYNGSFLQPLAVGIVSAILVALILVMGYLDIRRNEANLVGFMEDQALTTISVLLRQTEDNLKSIAAAKGTIPSRLKTAKEAESAYSIQLVFDAITKLGQNIDELWKKKMLNNAYLRRFAAEHHFWYVAVLNMRGDMIYQSGPLKTDMLAKSDLFVKGRKATTLELLEKIRIRQDIGYAGVKLKSGGGIAIFCLDRKSRLYWSLKVAVERAMSKMGEGHGIEYLQVFNDQKNLLGKIGDLPAGLTASDLNVQEMMKGKKRILSRKVDREGIKILDVAAPFIIEHPYLPKEKIAGIVRIGLDRGSMDKIIAENRQNIYIFMLFVAGIALLSMWLLYQDQNRHLAGIIEMERRLEKAERLSSLGQLAAGVAHEIRNPLNAISMATQRLKRDFIPAEEAKAREFTNLSTVIRDEIRRLNGIIEEFLSFSKSRRLELSRFSVTEVLQKIVRLITEEAASRNIVLETHWRFSPAIIPMDINKLQQAFLNFIKNAMESITDRGKITIAVSREGKKHVLVSIADTGCGMTPEEIEKVFSPEYTTKEKGLGLGIPLATEIIRGHGGDVRVISRPGEGTTFEIVLPMEKIGEKT